MLLNVARIKMWAVLSFYHGLSVCLFVCLCVCLLMMTVSCAKTAELMEIEMPFGMWSHGAQGTIN